MHGSSAPLLQKLSLKLLVQPCSSSCCGRNLSTYSFIHSLKRNKLDSERAEDLARKNGEYNQGSSKMWDISGDTWDGFDDVGNLRVTTLSLDEPNMQVALFRDDTQGEDEINIIPIFRQ